MTRFHVTSRLAHRPPPLARTAAKLALLLVLGIPALRAQCEPLVEAVDSIGITVSDIERATRFYRDVLGFKAGPEYEVAGDRYEHLFGVFGLRLRVTRMALGDEHIELMHFLAPDGRPVPVDSRSNDRWFQHIALVTPDMDRAYAWLRAHHVEHVSPGPQRLPDWNPDAGGIEAFYFRDPDHNSLEVLQFPPGKGAARWHAPSDRMFLGIDHTAIVVADTGASLAFYRDLLGMERAGHSENYGPEQERLNNVFGAHLSITALRASRGPGVELLEYLTPRDGRPTPRDTRAVDLWYWQINFTAADGSGLRRLMEGPRATPVSPTVVQLPGRDLGFIRGLLVRDPDGHASLLRQPK